MIESLIFFPEKNFYEKPQDFGFAFEEVVVKTPDHCELFGWFLPSAAAENKGALLFFHGNAGNIGNRLYKVKGWLERGFSVFLVDYRGYGKSTGGIKHEKDILTDARAALDWLSRVKGFPLPKIVLYGESLGSFAAVSLGADNSVGGVILEAPFTSLFEVAKAHYPIVTEGMMSHFKFSNLSQIGRLKVPLFILHGEQDEICPYSMAGELFDRAPEPKGFLSVPGAHHNDLPMAAGDDFYEKPCEFILNNAPQLLG